MSLQTPENVPGRVKGAMMPRSAPKVMHSEDLQVRQTLYKAPAGLHTKLVKSKISLDWLPNALVVSLNWHVDQSPVESRTNWS